MDPKITSVILGAVIGGVISFCSFHYKSRIEVKGKVNEALFHLLEVWSLIGAMHFVQSEQFFNKFIERIKVKFPREKFNNRDLDNFKKSMAKSSPLLLDMHSTGDGFYIDKYTSAVSALAPIYPIHAFELSKNQMLTKFINSFDALVAEEEITESDEIIISRMKNLFNSESFIKFENDLRSLSKKSGISNHRAVCKHIASTKNRMQKIPNKILDEYLNHVIAPLIQEHYDRLGIENPNLSITKGVP